MIESLRGHITQMLSDPRKERTNTLGLELWSVFYNEKLKSIFHEKHVELYKMDTGYKAYATPIGKDEMWICPFHTLVGSNTLQNGFWRHEHMKVFRTKNIIGFDSNWVWSCSYDYKTGKSSEFTVYLKHCEFSWYLLKKSEEEFTLMKCDYYDMDELKKLDTHFLNKTR